MPPDNSIFRQNIDSLSNPNSQTSHTQNTLHLESGVQWCGTESASGQGINSYPIRNEISEVMTRRPVWTPKAPKYTATAATTIPVFFMLADTISSAYFTV